MKKSKYLAFLLITVLFCGCASKMEVQKEAIDTMGDTLFSQNRFNLSREISLQEIVKIGEHLVMTAPGNIVVFNNELHFSQTIIGRFIKRFEENGFDKLLISFEELDDGKKPTLTFRWNPAEKRYYLETFPSEKDDYIADPSAQYGYSKISKGEIVRYDNKRYLLSGDNKVYLKLALDVHVVPERREIKGIKK